MAKKNDNEPREKHNEDIINELFGEIDEAEDLETNVADLGQDSEDDIKIAEDPRRQRFFFGFAVFVVIMAIIGLITCIRLIVMGIHGLVDNTYLKNEFTRFILPAVANDISSFNSEAEISNSAKINCSIWEILLNKDYGTFPKSQTGEYLIPEYDVGVACKEIFGSSSSITHQSVGYGDARFVYDEERHVYSCGRNLRNLSYAPRISEMTEVNGVYTLKVEYLPPSISLVADNLGVETDPDKTMIYTITRQDKKNILTSVAFPDNNTNVD